MCAGQSVCFPLEAEEVGAFGPVQAARVGYSGRPRNRVPAWMFRLHDRSRVLTNPHPSVCPETSLGV